MLYWLCTGCWRAEAGGWRTEDTPPLIPGPAAAASVLLASTWRPLETKVHTKVRNHGEVPQYWAFSRLKAATTTFPFKTLLGHFANQPAFLMTFVSGICFWVYLLCLGPCGSLLHYYKSLCEPSFPALEAAAVCREAEASSQQAELSANARTEVKGQSSAVLCPRHQSALASPSSHPLATSHSYLSTI